MSQLHTEEEILRKINLLPRELAPINDPWPEISARIGAVSSERVSAARRARWWPLAVAAAVVLTMATMLLPGRLWNSSLPDTAAPELSRQYPGAGTTAASEAEYRAAFRVFMASGVVQTSSKQHSMEGFGIGWSALRRAEVELQGALKEDPDNKFLNLHLQALRARQLELLQQIAAVDMAAWRDTI